MNLRRSSRFRAVTHRLTQFRLRSVFVLVGLAAIGIRLVIFHAHYQDDAVCTIHNLGGKVYYEVEYGRLSYLARAKWVKAILGEHAFVPVIAVSLASTNASDRDVAMLSQLKSLTALYLQQTNVSDRGLAYIRELCDLEVLDLSGTKVTDEGLVHLRSLTCLVRLSLDDNAVGDSGLSNVKDLTRLQLLSVEQGRVSSAGLRALSGLSQLTWLSLAGNTEVVDIVALRSLTQLEVLCLSNTSVDNAAIATIAQLQCLKMLLLDSTAITGDGVNELSVLTSLTDLDLSNTCVTERVIRDLQSMLPTRIAIYQGATSHLTGQRASTATNDDSEW